MRLSKGTSANHAIGSGSVIKEYSRGTPPMGTMRGYRRGIIAVGVAYSVQPERIPSPLRVCTGGVLRVIKSADGECAELALRATQSDQPCACPLRHTAQTPLQSALQSACKHRCKVPCKAPANTLQSALHVWPRRVRSVGSAPRAASGRCMSDASASWGAVRQQGRCGRFGSRCDLRSAEGSSFTDRNCPNGTRTCQSFRRFPSGLSPGASQVVQATSRE